MLLYEKEINHRENTIFFLLHSLLILNIFKPEHREEMKEQMYIAGGSIYSHIHKKPINDFDVYFRKPYTVEELKNKVISDYWRTISENALTILRHHQLPMVQFITRYHGEPAECLGKFDYRHCQYYFDLKKGKICSIRGDFKYLIGNTLSFNISTLSIPNKTIRERRIFISLQRAAKFENRGMKVDKRTEVILQKLRPYITDKHLKLLIEYKDKHVVIATSADDY